MRIARSEQWTEVEQHDQFCFALEGMASEYYTLLLETDPGIHLGAILRKFEKRFGSSAPDLTHQLNFQSAVQGSESLRQWSDRVLTLATRAFPQLPNVHVRAVAPEEEPQGTGDGRPSREIRDLQSRIKELKRALQERPPVQPKAPRTTSPPRAVAEGRSPPACYKKGEVKHYRRNCPRNSGAKATGNTGGGGGHPQRSRGPSPQTKGADGQEPGTERPGDPIGTGAHPRAQ